LACGWNSTGISPRATARITRRVMLSQNGLAKAMPSPQIVERRHVLAAAENPRRSNERALREGAARFITARHNPLIWPR